MIIDDITMEDVIAVLEHVQSVCALMCLCDGCRFSIPGEGCSLAHLPERWQLDQIGGDQNDICE